MVFFSSGGDPKLRWTFGYAMGTTTVPVNVKVLSLILLEKTREQKKNQIFDISGPEVITEKKLRVIFLIFFY